MGEKRWRTHPLMGSYPRGEHCMVALLSLPFFLLGRLFRR